MRVLKQFTSRIPFWAYLLVLLVVVVNTIYFISRFQSAVDGVVGENANGIYPIINIKPGSAADRAGLRIGDTVVSINSLSVDAYNFLCIARAGDTVSVQVIRNNQKVTITLVFDSLISESPVFFYSMYVLILLLSISSIYILYKKPADKAVTIFFIYIQLFAITSNAGLIFFHDFSSNFASFVFSISTCLYGVVLIHFHMLFPNPVRFYNKFRTLPFLLYGIGIFVSVIFTLSYYSLLNQPSPETLSNYLLSRDYDLKWVAICFIVAVAFIIYQFATVKNTLSRKQLVIVSIGSFFGFITPVMLIFFTDWINQTIYFPFRTEVAAGTGSLIMIICLLIAIFRYRIWDTEIFIRKALLYLGATAFITLSYLLLIWLVDQTTSRETNITRFLILAVSVILFLVLRDRIQRLIDRLFHRETYDSATVVSDFEEKLAGIYRSDELKEKIVQELDEIFHFKSFVFNLKINELIYEPAVIIGVNNLKIGKEFDVPPELERKLRKSQVFSPYELVIKPLLFEMADGELIVPLTSGDQPKGFFLCGHKKSERVYSHQDIRVLTLLARRVIALLHTATLYQKDLDRQLILERERARISQDMHDDIGAGLTKIAMISEAPVKMLDKKMTSDVQKKSFDSEKELKDRLDRIATSSREMISRLNVIVWALNPKYDTLDSLISYLRRYFGEYVENFGIQFKTDLPEQVPELSITPDTRRNIFYSVQEAIHNAVKHSGCSEISLAIQPHPPAPYPQGEGEQRKRSSIPTQLMITIQDNGKGIDKVNPGSGGNGLLNMKKRAEDLGGSFEILSSPSIGTRILFSIQL